MGNDPEAKPWIQFFRWKAKYDGQDPERAKQLLAAADQKKTSMSSDSSAAGVV